MNPYFKRFLVIVLIAVAILSLAGVVAFYYFLPRYYLPVMPVMLLLVALISILVFRYQLKLANASPGQFTRSIMVITFIKLVGYSVFAVLYVALNPRDAIPFIVTLFLIYIVFSLIENSEISRFLRRNPN